MSSNPGAGASAKTEGVAAPGCQVQLLRFDDPRWAEKKCSAARGSFSTLGAAWWVGAQGLPSAQYTPTRHTTTTLAHTLASERYLGEGQTLGVGEQWDVR